MIEAVEFENFKVLRDARLPLSPLTVIVGPNGSGKSTAIAGIGAAADAVRGKRSFDFQKSLSVKAPRDMDSAIIIRLRWGGRFASHVTTLRRTSQEFDFEQRVPGEIKVHLSGLRHFALDPQFVAQPVPLRPSIELEANGFGLAGVLDQLRDQHPERFESLNKELARWLPEYDRILFSTPREGSRAFALRISQSQRSIPSSELSEGTLLAIALLTLAYLPEPATILTIEEPDRGIHPRLLREVQDALYRLAYPGNFGESRAAVQVIATTHSPYFLDLFRDHPDQVVIAHKQGLEAKFERLSDRADIEEILGNSPLGEVWYSGILGGVPVGT